MTFFLEIYKMHKIKKFKINKILTKNNLIRMDINPQEVFNKVIDTPKENRTWGGGVLDVDGGMKANSVSIVTESGGVSDNVLENTSIEIRVYN